MKRQRMSPGVALLLPTLLGLTTGCQDDVLEPEAFPDVDALYAKPPKPPSPADAGGILAGTDLGTLGGAESEATDISPEGWIVGRSSTDASGIRRPFLWRDGRGMAELPLPARFEPMTDHEGVTYPLVINRQMTNPRRRIAGAAPDPERPDPDLDGIYSNSVIVWTTADGGDTWTAEDLPVPDFWDGIDPEDVWAEGVNDLGVLIAQYREPEWGAMVWDTRTAVSADDWVQLQDPDGALWTQADGINDAGVIVGFSRMYDWGIREYHAEYWLPPYTEAPIRLPDYQGWPIQQANGIKENGDVVGWAQQRNKKVTLIWRNVGDPQGIPSYGAPEAFIGPEMAVSITLAINACDQVVGGGTARDQDGSLFDLESVFPRGGARSSAINDMGWISGTSSGGNSVKGTYMERATLWKLPGGC
jgi:hypothetical protein